VMRAPDHTYRYSRPAEVEKRKWSSARSFPKACRSACPARIRGVTTPASGSLVALHARRRVHNSHHIHTQPATPPIIGTALPTLLKYAPRHDDTCFFLPWPLSADTTTPA